MTIASIRCFPVRLHLLRPMALLAGARTSVDNVIVEIGDDQGHVGLGEATPRPAVNGEHISDVVQAIRVDINRALVGTSPGDLAEVHGLLAGVVAPAGAVAAAEVAMLDVLAQAAGVPAYQYLGGATDRLLASALLTFAPAEEVLDEARQLQSEHGVRCFKLKIGKDVEADVKLATLLRAELPDALVYADANGGYDLPSALRFAAAARHLSVDMVEEPVPVDRPDWRRAIGRQTGITVIGDESCATFDSASAAITGGEVRGVALKLSRTGITATASILQTAAAHGATALMGFESTSSVGAAASLAFGAANPATASRPAELLSYTTLRDDPGIAGFVFGHGQVRTSDSPGLGVTLDRSTLDRARLDGQ